MDKGRGRDVRTLKMMDNFITDHNAGLTIHEIADKYQLSDWSVYNRLDEIAKNAGVTRESLLARPRCECDNRVKEVKDVEISQPIDLSKLRKHYDNVIADMDSLKQEIDNLLESEEEF